VDIGPRIDLEQPLTKEIIDEYENFEKMAKIEEAYEQQLKKQGKFKPFSIRQFQKEVYENREEIMEILD